MTERFNPRSRSDPYGSRINREHSPVLAYAIPWVTMLGASVLPVFFMASAMPLVPPLGFLTLIAWRLVRPGLLPVWAGLPLGLFYDLFSGQPFGSAALLWSLALLAIEAIEARFPWRGFQQDWVTASGLIILYLLLAGLLSGATLGFEMVFMTVKALWLQILLSVLLYPIIARLVARLDRLRLMRWRRIG
ncbi:rod shape-determining protein MreD [Sphingomonadaceae bacterium]|nr:rod shape-determining protein MreD [Sphingomonadaceae bacterium]